MELPLDGVKVVDFGQFIAVPAMTQLLVSHGASVTKVEPLHGEGSRHAGVYGESILRVYNRGKRSIALDLKSTVGRELARELISEADIVAQNLRPGVMDSFGLGADEMCAAYPHLIYATVSGFGLHGPSRLRSGLDIAAQAESGIMVVTGEPDREPQRVGFPVVDASSSYVLAQAVLAAYIRRLRTGIGEQVEVSLLEVAIHLQATNWGQYFLTREEITRTGNGQTTVAPAAEVMPTKDGSIVVSAYAQAHFSRLCQILGLESLPDDIRFATNEARITNIVELRTLLRDKFATMTSNEAMQLLIPAGIVAGRINSFADVMDNEDVKANEIVYPSTDIDGSPMMALRSPGTLVNTDTLPDAHLAFAGENTRELLAELGHSANAIEEMIRDGVVGTDDSIRLRAEQTAVG